MKKIRINFCGYNTGYDFTENLIYNILKTRYDIEVVEKPDYLIVGSEGIPFQYRTYDCIRIRLETENFSPDFCDFDYWIGFDDVSFDDRFFRLPLAFQEGSGEPWIPGPIDKKCAEELLNEKTHFCNFVYRHESVAGVRERLREKLSAYKDIVSPGNYLNNQNNQASKCGRYQYACSRGDKAALVRLSKFTIAGESLAYSGFITEKIVDAFKGHSIPIYYGSNDISTFFNEKAFIWCKSPNDVDSICDRVAQIDNDDDAYISMLCENPFNDEHYTADLYERLSEFVVHIFDQPYEMAKRRPDNYLVARNNSLQKEYSVKIEKRYKKMTKKSTFKTLASITRQEKGLLYTLYWMVKYKALELINR